MSAQIWLAPLKNGAQKRIQNAHCGRSDLGYPLKIKVLFTLALTFIIRVTTVTPPRVTLFFSLRFTPEGKIQ